MIRGMRLNQKGHIQRSKGMLARRLLRWYRTHGRSLLWRQTDGVYEILISEIMLQQTQVNQVLVKYRKFLKRYPTLRSLARAKTSEVIRAWAGMGYNNRAVRLQRLARLVLDEYHGKIPATESELLRLPGIGRYTANALLCFAFKRNVAVVDVNIRRVLSRLLRSCSSTEYYGTENDIWEAATLLLPEKLAYSWNQALMDLGATVCTARRPTCSRCPLKRWCRSSHLESQGSNKQSLGRRKRKDEPSYDGIPNRLYRGRILESLRRNRSDKPVSAMAIGKRIKENFRSSDGRWLRSLLSRMQRDGVVRVLQGGREVNPTKASGSIMIALPE